MILVTGSAGKTGRAVIQALLARGENPRALVHRPDQVEAMRALGVRDVLAGDMRSRVDLERAFAGISRVYHICPNVSPDEVSIGETVIAAARAAGVEHFVYHSVLLPQIEAMPHHWQKLLVEERLIDSGLPFTILQPAAYMQNLSANWRSIPDLGIFPVPYPAETRLSLVDLRDVAEAAALALTQSGHEYATYALVGTPGLSQYEVAAALGRCTGRPVEIEEIPLDVWERQARAGGLGDYQARTLVQMFRYYAQHGFSGSPTVLTWLLGRPPATLEKFIEDLMFQQALVHPVIPGD